MYNMFIYDSYFLQMKKKTTYSETYCSTDSTLFSFKESKLF